MLFTVFVFIDFTVQDFANSLSANKTGRLKKAERNNMSSPGTLFSIGVSCPDIFALCAYMYIFKNPESAQGVGVSFKYLSFYSSCQICAFVLIVLVDFILAKVVRNIQKSTEDLPW